MIISLRLPASFQPAASNRRLNGKWLARPSTTPALATTDLMNQWKNRLTDYSCRESTTCAYPPPPCPSPLPCQSLAQAATSWSTTRVPPSITCLERRLCPRRVGGRVTSTRPWITQDQQLTDPNPSIKASHSCITHRRNGSARDTPKLRPTSTLCA